MLSAIDGKAYPIDSPNLAIPDDQPGQLNHSVSAFLRARVRTAARNDSRHLSLRDTGRIAWIVYLAADLGCLSAGYFSGMLIRNGMSPASSRVRMMTLSAVLLPLSPLVAYSPTALLAVLIASIAAFGHLCCKLPSPPLSSTSIRSASWELSSDWWQRAAA